MNAVSDGVGRFAGFTPSITNMIRMDHTHVLALFVALHVNMDKTAELSRETFTA
jgi:hypothetical protein